MVKKITLFSLLFVLTLSTYAQIDTLWTDTASLSGQYTHGIAVDNNNNIIVGGATDYSSFPLTKYDENGNVLWANSYTQGYDIGDIVTDANNNIYVSISALSDYNIAVMKISPDGVVLWTSDSYTSDYSWANDINITPNGDLIAIGSDNENDGWAVIRVNQDGDIVWQNTYNVISEDNTIAESVTCDMNGNIIIVGVLGDEFSTLKLDADGNILWHDELSYTAEFGAFNATGVICNNSNSIYIVGASSLDDDMRFVKYDTDGNIIFEKIGTSNYACFDLVLYNDSTIITAGGIGIVNGGFLTDVRIEVFDTLGNNKYQKSFDIAYTDGIYSLALCNGSVVSIGQATGQNGDCGLIMKFDYTETSTGINNDTKQLIDFNCYPNPANNNTTISFYLEAKSKVKVSIYNSVGTIVNTISDSEYFIGKNEISWNLRNSAGHKVATGVYYIKLETQNYIKTSKIIIN